MASPACPPPMMMTSVLCMMSVPLTEFEWGRPVRAGRPGGLCDGGRLDADRDRNAVGEDVVDG